MNDIFTKGFSESQIRLNTLVSYILSTCVHKMIIQKSVSCTFNHLITIMKTNINTFCYSHCFLVTSRMLKHLWGEPSQAHFESFGYNHIIIQYNSVNSIQWKLHELEVVEKKNGYERLSCQHTQESYIYKLMDRDD